METNEKEITEGTIRDALQNGKKIILKNTNQIWYSEGKMKILNLESAEIAQVNPQKPVPSEVKVSLDDTIEFILPFKDKIKGIK